MKIIIPTRGRTNQQLTLSFLPRELRKQTTLVCPKAETRRLSCLDDDIKVVAQPDPNWKIAKKREWIVQYCLHQGFAKIIMLDDDLSFATRISAGDTHLTKIRGKELTRAFERLEEKLGPEFPHVGFGQRQGNNHEEGDWKSPGKMCYALGYYLPIVTKECQFDLVEVREDMCVSLQLLLKGYPNAIWTETVVDQRGYNLPGGASGERTVAISNAEARKLADLFPDYVRVVDKRAYTASVPRHEVVVQWKKALADGQRHRRL